MRLFARAVAAASLALLSACATKPAPPPEIPPAAPAPVPTPTPTPIPPPSPVGRNAVETGVKLETPRVLKQEEAARALAAFRTSCPAVITRTDASGLTQGSDWQALCAQAASLDPSFAPGFFYYGFDWVKVGDGRAFATGYYEPEIDGSRTPQPGYVPIYRLPPDLVRCTKPDGTAGRGRIDQNGTCTLYYTRAEIEDGALAGKGLELVWAKDSVELFFLEIQGSGRIRFDDGTEMRVGYAGQNGRDYVAIGRLLRDRAILPPGGANMEAIKGWIRANPDQGRELMRENLSYVFFKDLTGPGPLGALNVPVTPRASVAADPNYVPLGAPIYLHKADRPEVDGPWIAQDTGGAIKGPNRFDTFWGAGAEAVAIAGGMSASGEALILIPKGVAARALAQP
ncbi:MAG: rane-bound lytic murein transglycosylase [Sphingomonadales bacterium]|nr:rane-bound lytic murein transglycosylase [Sphingomonadales bacterium]